MTRLMHTKNSKVRLTINREIKGLFKGPLSTSLSEAAPFAKLLRDKVHEDKPAKRYFVSCLRHHFAKLLSSIEGNLKDNLSYFKQEYIEMLSELGLQHAQCYEVLAGKVGDSQKNVGTVAAKYVTLGIMHQPTKALVIVQSVHQKIMQHASLSGKLPYVVCLANVDFGKVEDKNVLHKCLEIFMGLSKQIVMLSTECETGEKGFKAKRARPNVQQAERELSSKLLRHLTRGVNRILPHLKNFEAVNSFFETRAESFFRLSHKLPSRAKVQLLIFLFQLASGDMYSSLATRFMNSLYSSLKDSTLMTSSLAEAYFDLLYSALSADHDDKRIMSFVKRIFARALHCPARVALAVLVFFARLAKDKPVLKMFLDNKKEGLAKVGLVKGGGKKGLIGFREIESGEEEEESQGEIQEEVQVEKEVEEEKEIKEEKSETQVEDLEQNEIEKERSAIVEEFDLEFQSAVIKKRKVRIPEKKGVALEKSEETAQKSEGFDFNKRNPTFARGNLSGLWELFFFADHYHYLVRKFARMILSGKVDEILYKGNPVVDFNLSSIVNRLIVRPVKKVNCYRVSTRVQILRFILFILILRSVSREILFSVNDMRLFCIGVEEWDIV